MNIEDVRRINACCLTSEWLSEHRYTDDAYLVLGYVWKRSLQCNIVGEVPPVIVLLSMLRWERRLGLAVFEEWGGNRRSLEWDIVSEICSTAEVSAEPLLDMRAINDVAIAAYEEARTLGKDYVGTEHLFLALLKSEDDMLRRLFTKHGLTYELFKDTLAGMK